MNGMNWRGIRAVMRKDLKVVTRSKMIMLPMIILPVILLVIFPLLFGLAAIFGGDMLAGEMDDFRQMMGMMPPQLLEQWQGLDMNALFFQLMAVYAFAPMFLIVPMMVASVIAADSFVGERERKTLEALLYTPLTNRELLAAKMLTALLAALVVELLSFVLYAVVVNAVGWPLMGRIFFPNVTWIIMVVWLGPAVAALGLGLTVLISSRVSTFQEAYQLGGIVVLPIVALMIGQFAGVVYFRPGLVLGLGLVVWIIDAVIVWFGVQTFDRDALLARL